MMRRNFADVLKDIKIDVANEYAKLYKLFFDKGVYKVINDNFNKLWFSETFLTLDEFNSAAKFNFREKTEITHDEIEYLISFCEYVYNIVLAASADFHVSKAIHPDFFIRHINSLIEKMGYMHARKDNFTIFVEKSLAAIAVAEIVPKDLGVMTLSYNHYSMRGDLSLKKSSLNQFANYLEPMRKRLESVDSTLENDVFYAFNNFDIRHNNTNPEDNKYYKKFIANMNKNDLEKLYDETYQMCLLAILQLDNIDRKKYFNSIKKQIASEDKD